MEHADVARQYAVGVNMVRALHGAKYPAILFQLFNNVFAFRVYYTHHSLIDDACSMRRWPSYIGIWVVLALVCQKQ